LKLSLQILASLFTTSRIDKKGINLICPCPKCGQSEFGIAIDIENHPCNCYRKRACGWEGNIYSLLKELGRTDLLSSEKDYSKIVQRVRLENLIEKTVEKTEENLIPNVSPPIGFKRIESHPYLQERQFDYYDKYIVGTTKLDPKLKNNYIIFLVKQHNETKGYIARHIWNKEKIDTNNNIFKETGVGKFIKRYSNSPGTDFSSLLFGYDEITKGTKTVILVEGMFDKFRVDKLLDLHESEEIKCVASFKCHLSTDQKSLLKKKKIEDLILLYDYDVVKQIISNINDIRYDFKSINIGFHESKDPGDFELEDIEDVILNLQSCSSFLSSKLPVLQLE
jgi:hypothetical protein